MEIPQKEIKTNTVAQKSQPQMEEDLKARIKSSQLEIKTMLEEIQRERKEMEFRLSAQADLVSLIEEVSTNLTSVDHFFQKMEKSQTSNILEFANQEDPERGLKDVEKCLDIKVRSLQTALEVNGLVEEYEQQAAWGKTVITYSYPKLGNGRLDGFFS